MSLLSVRNLVVRYPGSEQHAVSGVSFDIGPGETVGLIGESGSGKTQTALALMGLLPPGASASGSVLFEDTELLGAPAAVLNRYRPCRMAMVFQDPQQALNPYVRIGDQLQRVVLTHRLAPRSGAAARVQEMLGQVGLPDPGRQMHAWPHQLSGGMRQRVMIAAALLGDPDLLIADEPTTALDVTVQMQILDLLRSLRHRFRSALLLITHDLGVVAGNCERMLVLEQGQLIEAGTAHDVFRHPRHERTRAMVEAATPLHDIAVPVDAPARDTETVLSAAGLFVSHYEKPRGAVWRRDEVQAVRDVGFELRRGETLALVGESGSGKTSLARALLGLVPHKSGEIWVLGTRLHGALSGRPLSVRRDLQLVFQDPAASLNPAMRVRDIVAEPLQVHERTLGRDARYDAVARILERVGLAAELGARFPHELSGGQAQRVAIARALIASPRVLVCDEAVAALDGSMRHEILDLLQREQQRSGLSLLFISHDLGVVKQLSHRVLVMYMGRVCEVADSAALFTRPRHPYTRALIDSVPQPDPDVPVKQPELRGEVTSLRHPPSGCVFHPRCHFVIDRCRVDAPAPLPIDGTIAACHRADELDLRLDQA
ncbi:MAG: ABC transporter ATP-binding protein [Woeseia sp.]